MKTSKSKSRQPRSACSPGNGKPVSGTRDGALADRLLVDRCLTGEEAAWERLFRQCQPGLLSSIRAMLGRQGADKDLVDEMAARVWYYLVQGDGYRLGRYDPGKGCRLNTFLATLARQQILQYRTAEHRRRIREHSGCRQEVDNGSGNMTEQQHAELMEFISTLTPREREFCEGSLLAARADSEQPQFSPSNRWQLRHRVLRKLQDFLRVDAG